MLSLEIPAQQVGSLLVYSDHAIPTQFYYAAPNPALAVSGGQPMFDLFAYSVELKTSPLSGTKIPDELGAGFLTMGVECVVSEAARRAAAEALSNRLGLDVDAISLSPIPYTKGSVSVIALDAASGAVTPPTPATTPGRPRFVEQVVGAGTPSLLGDLRSIFSLSLSQDGVTFLQGLFADNAAPIGVVYDLTFLGLRPSIQAHVHADVGKIYESFGGKASVGCAYVRAEIDGEMSRLEQTGAVTVELTSQAVGDQAEKDKQLALQMFQDKIIQQLFNPAPQMPNFQIPGMPNAQQASIVTLTLKAQKDEELRTVDYDFSERSPEERTHAPQGFLATLLTPEELGQRIHLISLDSEFFELLEVLVSGPTDDEYAALSLKSVTADLTYGSAGDPVPPVTESLLFRPGAEPDRTWAVKRQGRPSLAYTVDLTYEFMRNAGVDADTLTVRTGPRTHTGRTLSIRPYDDMAILDVEIDVGHLDASVTSVDVALSYQDPISGFGARQDFRLDPRVPMAAAQRHWQVRTTASSTAQYAATSVLSFDDGAVLTLPTVTTSESLLRIDSQFRATRSLLIQPHVTSGDVSSVTVEITYDDDEANYHRRFTRVLTAAPVPEGTPPPPAPEPPAVWLPVTVTWPILDATKQEIKVRVTTAAGGVIEAGEWDATSDPSLIVGEVGHRSRAVEVRLIGPPLAQAGLDALQVRVGIAGTSDDEAQSAFFDPSAAISQTLALPAAPTAAPGFRYQTTAFRSDGTQHQSAWTDTAQPLIVISTRTV